MFITDVKDLLAYHRYMRLSEHALREAHKESLRAKDVFYAIFNGQILENDRDRWRVLILGPTARYDVRLHVVCDYNGKDEIVAVTVYVPDRPRWSNDTVRGQ